MKQTLNFLEETATQYSGRGSHQGHSVIICQECRMCGSQQWDQQKLKQPARKARDFLAVNLVSDKAMITVCAVRVHQVCFWIWISASKMLRYEACDVCLFALSYWLIKRTRWPPSWIKHLHSEAFHMNKGSYDLAKWTQMRNSFIFVQSLKQPGILKCHVDM